jgi:hypothetical protein
MRKALIVGIDYIKTLIICQGALLMPFSTNLS